MGQRVDQTTQFADSGVGLIHMEPRPVVPSQHTIYF